LDESGYPLCMESSGSIDLTVRVANQGSNRGLNTESTSVASIDELSPRGAILDGT
jgi:hypothetical protein